MTRLIAHISDLHFGRHNPLVVQRLADDLRNAQPDLLVVSGDLTQRARRREFIAARTFLDSLGMKLLVVPGNHDIPLYNFARRMLGPLGRYQRYVSEARQPCFSDDELAVVGIDTARALVISGGRINHLQLEELGRNLRDAPTGTLRIVVTHHPLMAPPERPMMPLVGRAGEAAANFETNAIDIVLAGHFHDSFTADLKTQHPSLGRSILVIHAGTATSTRTRNAPNSYNLLEIAGDELTLHVRQFAAGAFQTIRTEEFRRTADGCVGYSPAV